MESWTRDTPRPWACQFGKTGRPLRYTQTLVWCLRRECESNWRQREGQARRRSCSWTRPSSQDWQEKCGRKPGHFGGYRAPMVLIYGVSAALRLPPGEKTPPFMTNYIAAWQRRRLGSAPTRPTSSPVVLAVLVGPDPGSFFAPNTWTPYTNLRDKGSLTRSSHLALAELMEGAGRKTVRRPEERQWAYGVVADFDPPSTSQNAARENLETLSLGLASFLFWTLLIRRSMLPKKNIWWNISRIS